MIHKNSLALTLASLLLFSCSLFADPILVAPGLGGAGIQSALDALPAGGEVVLNEGRYLICQPVILQKNGQSLRGRGISTVLYLADSANCPVVILGSPRADKPSTITGLRLADLFIDGNRKNQQKETWRFVGGRGGLYNNGVDVWDADDATVENVVCCRCRSGGMVSAAGTRRLTVRNFTAFDNQFDGLACYLTEDSHFSRLNLHDNLSAGISLDLDFNHNVIQNATLTGNDLGVFMRQSKNNVFDDLTIEASRHHGVFMAQSLIATPAGWRPSPASECSGNRFNKLVVEHCAQKGFVVNDVTCTNNVICGARFADNAGGELAEAAPHLLALEPLSRPLQPAPIEAVMSAIPAFKTPVIATVPGLAKTTTVSH